MTDETMKHAPGEPVSRTDRVSESSTSEPPTPRPPSIVEIESRRPFTIQSQRPRITALEIENFKAIGRKMRIDLKPITLLFGNNSAGKSTILQALAYASGILNRDQVDAHEIDLGNSLFDLGGFGNFVHAHDLDRTIKLRFDIDLRGWRGPARQLLRQYRVFPEFSDVQTGRVTLSISHDEILGRPKFDAYEVEVNDELVGRLETIVHPAQPAAVTTVDLLTNLSHPLLDFEDVTAPTTASGGVARVRETIESTPDNPREFRLATLYRSSPMPRWAWEEPIVFKPPDNYAATSRVNSDETQARLSGLLVGIGKWLRDELAEIAHVGPLRKIQDRNIWDRLNDWETWKFDRVPHWFPLVEKVSDWLSRKDRLDTGYSLHLRSWFAIPDPPELVRLLQQYHELRTEYQKTDGTVDIDGFARASASWVLKNRDQFDDGIPGTVEELATQIKAGNENISVEANGKRYRDLAALVAKVEKRQFTTKEINELAAAAAGGRTRQEPQLVDTRKGVHVRVEDVGMGISQILPVVVAALDPGRPSITAIEQPELHLHPRVQVELGDLFAAALDHPIKRSDRHDHPGIFLIETHSEHLLQRIMRRMRQTGDGVLPEGAPALRPEDVGVFFVEPEDAETLVREIRLNERGELVDPWPGGFFEEDLREMFDMDRDS